VESYNAPGHVGLLNQGATCYLNSLLQCLYNDTGFREAIFSANTASSPIVSEIQKLFAKMQLSDCSAISTTDLSVAFGWERSQIFEQHDVHELLSVLVDALGNVSSELQTKLNGLFQGSITGRLAGPLLPCEHLFTAIIKRQMSSVALNASTVVLTHPRSLPYRLTCPIPLNLTILKKAASFQTLLAYCLLVCWLQWLIQKH
jgi:uncharacterized UBP type Zn finger protein